MPSAHAKLGPSASKRWGDCPGSIAACDGIIDTGNDAANEGTAGHEVHELCAASDAVTPGQFVGRSASNGVVITEALAKAVQVGIDWLRKYKAERNALLFTERQVDVGRAFGLPVTSDGKTNCWGTADIVGYNHQELLVYDLKLGYGYVPVQGNSQLRLYGAGLLHELDIFSFERVRFVICQPRHADDPIREEVVTAEEMRAWVAEWKPKVHAALDPLAPRTPSEEACQWCRAAPVCPALHEQTLAMAQREFSKLDALTPEQLAELLSQAKMIKGVLKRVQEHALGLAKAGIAIPGYKLVASVKHRVWRDDGAALRRMVDLGQDEDAVAPRKLISPAAAEKIVGKDEVAKLAEKPEGLPVLVPESDRRKPLVLQHFEPIPELPLAGPGAGQDGGLFEEEDAEEGEIA